MIDQNTFDLIKDNYGYYSSWAIWVDAGEKPKDNIGDLRIFDPVFNPSLLQQLNPNVIFVGLNVSRGSLKNLFGNFHDPRPEGMDFKLRFALKGTPFWGAYITDIIKDFDELNSGKVMDYLKTHRSFEIENANIFREEIADLGSINPILIALGTSVYQILVRNFKNEYKIQKIPHYSNWGGKEKYRGEVRSILEYEEIHYSQSDLNQFNK